MIRKVSRSLLGAVQGSLLLGRPWRRASLRRVCKGLVCSYVACSCSVAFPSFTHVSFHFSTPPSTSFSAVLSFVHASRWGSLGSRSPSISRLISPILLRSVWDRGCSLRSTSYPPSFPRLRCVAIVRVVRTWLAWRAQMRKMERWWTDTDRTCQPTTPPHPTEPKHGRSPSRIEQDGIRNPLREMREAGGRSAADPGTIARRGYLRFYFDILCVRCRCFGVGSSVGRLRRATHAFLVLPRSPCRLSSNTLLSHSLPKSDRRRGRSGWTDPCPLLPPHLFLDMDLSVRSCPFDPIERGGGFQSKGKDGSDRKETKGTKERLATTKVVVDLVTVAIHRWCSISCLGA